MRTYLNVGMTDYLNKHYAGQPTRMAIFPFDVPEKFVLSRQQDRNFGVELAELFQRELLRSGELHIVELFDRDNWPGKRSDFFSGNYEALDMARNAGYDLVLVGRMEDIVNDEDITVVTKIIDTSNGVTLWSSKTVSYSKARPLNDTFADLSYGGVKRRPELFHFPERTERVAVCTVERIFHEDVMLDETSIDGSSHHRRIPIR